MKRPGRRFFSSFFFFFQSFFSGFKIWSRGWALFPHPQTLSRRPSHVFRAGFCVSFEAVVAFFLLFFFFLLTAYLSYEICFLLFFISLSIIRLLSVTYLLEYLLPSWFLFASLIHLVSLFEIASPTYCIYIPKPQKAITSMLHGARRERSSTQAETNSHSS